jgi:hypothetical protein
VPLSLESSSLRSCGLRLHAIWVAGQMNQRNILPPTQDGIRQATIMTTHSYGWHSIISRDPQNESSLLRRTQISQPVPKFTCTRSARIKSNSVCLVHKNHIIDLLLHHCHSNWNTSNSKKPRLMHLNKV